MYALIEAVDLGRATARLAGNGARLTNLMVVGNLPVVGDKVIVDYASGTPPVVRLLGGE